ncbi:hypothetical protein BX666DRAFT_1873073 [Dichotomocladium elegans]|nr:hypothetical protein BX666DRAFT_1873073 [Dichotomocladium elegans]
MALPNSQHFSRSAESNSASKPKNHSKRSYAQVVTASKRVSLMHKGIEAPDIDEGTTYSRLQTRVYRSSRTMGALLLSISPVLKDYSELQCMQLVKEQHPEVYGCTIANDGSHRYLEIYIQKDSNDLAYNGVKFPNAKLQILPCQAIDDTNTITKVTLTNLPMLPPTEVLAGLQESLQPFGNLVDIGIVTEPTTGLFMGSGYAVLSTNPTDSTIVPLAHTVMWQNTDEVFHCTWNNMPTWCRYCHETGHTKFECEKSKARIRCYNCHQLGHRAFECPRKTINPQAKKRKTTPAPVIAESIHAASTETASPSKPIEAESLQDESDTDIVSDADEDIDDMEVEQLVAEKDIPLDELMIAYKRNCLTKLNLNTKWRTTG